MTSHEPIFGLAKTSHDQITYENSSSTKIGTTKTTSLEKANYEPIWLVSRRHHSKPPHKPVKICLPVGFSPSENDVICARGKTSYYHRGNQRFREIVGAKKESYMKAKTRVEKGAIITDIVDTIRSRVEVGGFVRFEKNERRWIDVGDYNAREKVGQYFRDLASGRANSKSRTSAQDYKQKSESDVSLLATNSPEKK
mmetsp:Transcript_31960/g.48886  ORF Transcript_31960/g.48886 Transcript_31960/m.48886 type:complete len:197 (-) Transcript_31960:139-729(-)